MSIILNYFQNGTWATVLVFVVLSTYLISVLWVFIYRFFYLSSWMTREKDSLERLALGHKNVSELSVLSKCSKYENSANTHALNACLKAAEKDSSTGLTILSIVASTSPFVGLFGTVISILDSFAKMGVAGGASLNVLAPAISEALVATACGIFVAVPAYAFHLMLKRKSYEVLSYLQMQIELLKS
ncbi:MAG: MotA/TolQ/ExbB proton channel family protein [Campylobacterales bacterium]|nr:MotA/TolQ/ExbB proton channel family protein [Campylobacterales bacterium]